jgi:hypothetical protein
MRDFRDAKAMAHTLRAALAAKGFKITVSQSLELIAEAFGVADWNTLAAAIRRADLPPRENASGRPSPIVEWAPAQMFSRELELTLHRALAHAEALSHEYATLEHLLFALIDDGDASAVMKAGNVDLGALKAHLANYIDNELKTLTAGFGGESRPTAAFQRVLQRAAIHLWNQSREMTGSNVLVAMFAETQSPAVRFLGEQGMTRQDAVNVIVKASGDAIVRQRFSHERTKPVVVEKPKRRTAAPTDRKPRKKTNGPRGWRSR